MSGSRTDRTGQTQCRTVARPRVDRLPAVRGAHRDHGIGGQGSAGRLCRLPVVPVGLACPNCQNMMTSMGNGIFKCLNCGYTIT